ncbi:hypothetical protein GCM10009530_27270 [Microbispora corallina]|uniref:hypothetical protein n=2 Tax=Microbispora corallina TaxID=83302 RepID=UPI0031D50565
MADGVAHAQYDGARVEQHQDSSLLPAAAQDGTAAPERMLAVSAPAGETAAADATAGHTASGCPGAGDEFLFKGHTTASYFWDDGSGVNGDTGAPASGEPMQKGLVASPSWPMGTKGYVLYDGKKADFFVGDRGPGVPSSSGVMIDLDGKTFAELTGGTWNHDSYTVQGVGGIGHIAVQYVITEWGSGPGKKGAPVPFSDGAYAMRHSPDPCPHASAAPSPSPSETAAAPAADPSASAPAVAKAVAENAPRNEQGSQGAAGGAGSQGAQAVPETTAPKSQATGAATGDLHTVSAVTPQPEQDLPVPVVSTAVIACALAACGAKLVFRRGSGHR